MLKTVELVQKYHPQQSVTLLILTEHRPNTDRTPTERTDPGPKHRWTLPNLTESSSQGSPAGGSG